MISLGFCDIRPLPQIQELLELDFYCSHWSTYNQKKKKKPRGLLSLTRGLRIEIGLDEPKIHGCHYMQIEIHLEKMLRIYYAH